MKPGFNLSFAAKMHGCQGKNAAKAQEILEKLAASVKKFLANCKKEGIIADGKARLFLNAIKKGPDRSRVQASFASVILS